MNAMNECLLSPYGQASTTPAPVSAMMNSFAGSFRDGIDINLGVGYVNESTLPRVPVREAVENVLSHPETYRCALNYGGPKGSPNLADAIRAFHDSKSGSPAPRRYLEGIHVVIGPSGVTSLLEAIAQVMEKGIVITSDPMYYIYCHFLERMGFDVITVPEDAEGIQTDRLKERLEKIGSRRRDIRFFYVVTVNNPTCTILSNNRRKELLDIAVELSLEFDRKVPLFLDAAYETLIHDPSVEPSSCLFHEDRYRLVHELHTLSKILAPALRIGYMLCPPSPLLDSVIQRVSDVGFSAPLFTQEIAGYLLQHHAAEQIRTVKEGYREKAILVRGAIEKELGPYLEDCSGGQGGFYYYLTLKEIETHSDSHFFKYLSRTTGNPEVDGSDDQKAPRVIYVPGAFCVHPRGELVDRGKRQLRLSYGFEEIPVLAEALSLMGKAAHYASSSP